MRLMILSTASGYGGAERSVEEYLPLMSSIESVFVVASNSRHISQVEKLKSSDGKISVGTVLNGRNPIQILLSLAKILSYVWTFRPTHILANNNKGALFLALLHFIPAKRYKSFAMIRDFQWANAKWIIQRLNSIGCKFGIPTQAVLDLWPTSYGPKPTSVSILCEPIRPIVIDENKKAKDPTIVSLGTITRWKGFHILIEAFPIVLQSVPNAKVIIAGEVADTEYFQEIQEQAKRLGVMDRVEFRGFSDPAEILSIAHCVVNAAIPEFGGPETFGRVVVEAWSCGRPVVVSNCGGPSFIVNSAVNALTFGPSDHFILAQALIDVLLDTTLAKKISNNGFFKYEYKYSLSCAMSQISNFLEPF